MRSVLFLACVALVVVGADAFTVHDPAFAIKTAIPSLNGAALTFNPQGDLFVYDTQRFGNGCLFRFPAASSLPFGQTIPFVYGGTCAASGGKDIGLGFSSIISTDTGRLYLTNGWEIDPISGAHIRQAFNPCGSQHGIARDPRDGALFISNYAGRKIYRVENPDNHPNMQNTCATPFANTNLANTGIDGLTVGPDGLVYMAGYDASTFLVYSAYTLQTPTGTKLGETSTNRFAGAGPDGISICFGDGVSFAITADSGSQTINRFNLTGPGGAPTYAYSPLVSSTGGYNDWTAVDPKGCIWGSTVNGVGGVYRLSNADGSCMQCAAPQNPSSCDCNNVATIPIGASSGSGSSTGPCLAIRFA